MRTLIKNATIVNEGRSFKASLTINGDRIERIAGCSEEFGSIEVDNVVDADGCFLLPGVIDDHVHFRDPGLTHKADMETESRAAAFGGVTSYFDMPNTKPQTTTIKDLEDKFEEAKRKSHVNYSFFIGATNSNINELLKADSHRVPGVKLFMGSSTGNMLVDKEAALRELFSKVKMPIMAHCEDTSIINRNMELAKQKYGDDPAVEHHPEIRSSEACLRSTKLAVDLAKEYGARLHVAHLSTAEELNLFEKIDEVDILNGGSFPKITAEAVVAHLMFSEERYADLGARIKCNPAIKGKKDKEALRNALNDGHIAVIGTDHAPHLISEKQGGCCNAMSGMPMLQFSLVAMLSLVDEGVMSIERLVELMAHNPALLFGLNERGFIREGYKADIVIVKPNSPWTVTASCIESKCKWSPLEGTRFNWKVEHTFCNGHHILNNGIFDNDYRGEELVFNTK